MIALLIIALLAGLMLPVLAGARKKARQTHCVENMRQLHLAWKIYLNDYHGSETDSGSYPPYPAILPYIKSTNTLICPEDPMNGYRKDLEPSRIQTSYAYIGRSWPGSLPEQILKSDPNPGIFACALHGKCRPTLSMCRGLVLRVRLDGSYGRGYIPLICLHDTRYVRYMLHPWYYFTDVPPPELPLIGRLCDPEDW